MMPFRIILIFLLTLLSNYVLGQRYQGAIAIGGIEYDDANSIAIDEQGNKYVAGYFYKTVNFDPGNTNTTLTAKNDNDIFLAKFDSADNFKWVISMGANGHDYITSMVYRSGYLYLNGSFQLKFDFDPGSGTDSIFSVGDYDGFMAKFDTARNLKWVRTIGNRFPVYPRTLAVDSLGNSYHGMSHTDSIDADPSNDTFMVGRKGGSEILTIKLDSNGHLVWAKSVQSTGDDAISQILLGDSNRLYYGGFFRIQADFDPSDTGVFTLKGNTGGSLMAYTSSLDLDGNFRWARSISGTYHQSVTSITQDRANNIYVTGHVDNGTVNYDYPNTHYITEHKNTQIIYVKYDNHGNLIWAKQTGGDSIDAGRIICSDSLANIYILGQFSRTADFDPGPREYLMTSNGKYDIFVMKMDSSGNFKWARQIGGTGVDRPLSMILADDGRLYISGSFERTVDFNPNSGTDNRTAKGLRDAFVLSLNPCINATYDSISIEACNFYIAPSTRLTFDSSGTYYDTLVNYEGCDSIVTINLIVHYDSDTVINANVCDGMWSPDGLEFYDTSGTYFDTIPNSFGCDSIIQFNITIYKTSYKFRTFNACDSLISPSQTKVWYTSGLHRDTIPNHVGCDSVISTLLTIKSSSTGNDSIVSCTSVKSPSGRNTWTSSGTYFDTLINAVGCDSIITFKVEIIRTSDTTISLSGCDSIQSPSGKKYWYSSGQYHDTLINTKGCDSILTVNASIYPSQTIINSISSCDSFFDPISQKHIYASTIVKDTFTTSKFCDSIVITDITISHSVNISIADTACVQYISPSEKHSWSSSGTYSDTLNTVSGCDSILSIELTIVNLANDFQIQDNSLIAIDSSINYQWLDCDKDYDEVPGEINRTFTPLYNADFALESSRFECYDTSKCKTVDFISIKDLPKEFIKIHPNPTSNFITINTSETVSGYIKLFDALGRELKNLHFINLNGIEIQLPDVPSIYFLVLTDHTNYYRVFRVRKL